MDILAQLVTACRISIGQSSPPGTERMTEEAETVDRFSKEAGGSINSNHLKDYRKFIHD